MGLATDAVWRHKQNPSIGTHPTPNPKQKSCRVRAKDDTCPEHFKKKKKNEKSFLPLHHPLRAEEQIPRDMNLFLGGGSGSGSGSVAAWDNDQYNGGGGGGGGDGGGGGHQQLKTISVHGFHGGNGGGGDWKQQKKMMNTGGAKKGIIIKS